VRPRLAHTSGIEYAFSNPIVARLQRGSQKSEWEIPLLGDPGEKWNYSASTAVLGLIVEKITSTPLETWYQEGIFKRLGMVDTSAAVAADKRARVVRSRGHQTCARAEHPEPRHGHAAGTAEGDDSVDADPSIQRRWRPVLHCSRLRTVHADAAERRATWRDQDTQRELSKNDGPESDRVDFRRGA